jgi:ABC-type arginine transport system ATPase subunit
VHESALVHTLRQQASLRIQQYVLWRRLQPQENCIGIASLDDGTVSPQ